MITEDYVSLEIAKLLKDKGFDEYCFAAYSTEIGDFITIGPIKNSEIDADKNVTECMEPGGFGNLYANGDNTYICTAPTHQMAMKWLREKGIYIQIRRSLNTYMYGAIILRYGTETCGIIHSELEIYEESVEASLKYCLTNLI